MPVFSFIYVLNLSNLSAIFRNTGMVPEGTTSVKGR